MKPIGHPLRAPCPLFLLTAAARYFFVTLAALAVLAGCAGSGTVPESGAPLVIVDETLPLPIEGERLNMRAIERVSRLAKSESLLVARHERNQLLLADIDASTLVAIDSQLAWFSGDVTLADQLLEKLARDNTAALDFVLSEQEQRSALAGDWLDRRKTPVSPLPPRICRPSRRCRERPAVCLPTAARQRNAPRAAGKRYERPRLAPMVRDAGGLSAGGWRHLAPGSTQTNALPQSPAIPRHLTQWTKPPDLDRITLLLPLEGTLAAAGEAVLVGRDGSALHPISRPSQPARLECHRFDTSLTMSAPRIGKLPRTEPILLSDH